MVGSDGADNDILGRVKKYWGSHFNKGASWETISTKDGSSIAGRIRALIQIENSSSNLFIIGMPTATKMIVRID